ncbi:hypothetical protein J5N97_013565 [Dioscorea zingiberensis]|uniref:Uncharacterized protein n=1 Tax=Dioscorea zingiberensis TaxID=325984 RepID=A0A9D5HIR6_9LILI|nr:hypothetical protein J5N97_013565 [Dioscorea zingiberensis]
MAPSQNQGDHSVGSINSHVGLPALDVSIAFPQATPASIFPPSESDYYQFDDLLSDEEQVLRRKVREVMEKEIAPIMTVHWEKAEFPYHAIPKLASLKVAGGTIKGLTEPDYGSDASSLRTTATKVSGGWILDGQKRWIGNSTFADVFVIFARNMETNQINGFIVMKGAPGLRATKIENKIGLRIVQNGDILLKKVFVPEEDRLPGVNSFQDTSKVLFVSRVMVAWRPIGISMGVFDMCQWGWISLKAREAVSLGRELLGGNGILADFLVAKAFCDLEPIFSYEGTYDINDTVAVEKSLGLQASNCGLL